MEISGAASSRLYSTSSRRPEPIQSVSPLPQSFSPSTLIRFSTRSLTAWDSIESSLEAHAIKERVEKRMSVLGEQLWGNGDVVWIGSSRLDDVLYRREEAAPEISIVYGVVEQ